MVTFKKYEFSLEESNINYDYPEGLDLRPGSNLHDSILAKIMQRAFDSAKVMIQRHTQWQKVDNYLTTYKYTDDEENTIKNKDPRKPVSMVFPQSYATLETLLSYMVAAFFRDPIIRYEGSSPEDVMGAILLEKVVDLHVHKFKVGLNLHTMFRDAFSYGIAPVLPTWVRTQNNLYEGNALVNIDPYLYIPDTTFPANNIQDGEFVSWINHTNYFNLLESELLDENIFNVRYIKRLGNSTRTSLFTEDPSNRNIKSGMYGTHTYIQDNIIDELYMYIKLIPREWNLGDNEYPEKWFFRVAADNLIISARPADFDHNKFPVAICVPDYDGYSPAPLSRMEIMSDMQGLLDFLLNSHMTNVRKAINDSIIYDPYVIDSNDMKDPAPGKLIRVRKRFWGNKDVISGAVKQLQINDITRANVADSNWVIQLMQKVSATDDVAMGVLRNTGPERLTGAEFKGTQMASVSRLERVARIMSMQALQDIGEFFAEHTKQIMENDVFIKIAGDTVRVLMDEFGERIDRGRLQVSPKDIDIFYDVKVRDGSVPNANYSAVWIQLFQMISQDPELRQRFDLFRIFKTIARNNGVKNVNDFIKVLPNEQIDQEIQAGNIVPLQQQVPGV
jgi:hypothetical protein